MTVLSTRLGLALLWCVAGARHLAAQEIDDPRTREEWFWLQRSYPFETRPYAAMARARRDVMNNPVFARRSSSSSFAPLLSGAWRPLGPWGLLNAGTSFSSLPQLDAGRVVAIVPPSTPGGAFIIGTASGGVWRASSLGAIWQPTTDDQCALTIGAVASDPVNPSIVYAATGEYNSSSFGCGVLRSLDGGLTWTSSTNGLSLGNGASGIFGGLLIDRATAGSATSTTILGATREGLVRSTSSGVNWTTVLAGSPSSIVSTRTGTLFTGMRDLTTPSRRGVWKSTNTGATWVQLPLLPQADQSLMGRIELAVSPAAPDKVFAIVGNTPADSLLGLWVWDDAGSTWTRLTASGAMTGVTRTDFGIQPWWNLVLTVDPKDANRMYIAGVRALRSTDGGATFKPFATEVHTDWHQIVVDPFNTNLLYAGTDGGVFVSADRGDTWTDRNSGLAITQYYPGISVNASASMITGGSQDNGTHLFSGSQFWDGFSGGDGGYTAINPANNAIQWSESQWSNTGAAIFRRDALSISFRTSGIAAADRAQFIPPLVLDPITPTKLYFGTHRLYRTTNEGLLWTPISADLTKGSGAITTIAVAPSDSLTLYVGTSDGLVQVTRNGGGSFTQVATGLPDRFVTRLVVDPADATHVLVTVSGFGSGHIFETNNAGTSWRDISGNLVNAPANAAVFVSGTANIFVGTDVGVFQTADDGATWQAGPTGMPNVIIHDLVYQPKANRLVAATYGRGMYMFAPGGETAVLRGDANADGKVDAFDALLIQQALVGLAPSGTAVYPRGDANCNGVLDSGDVLAVLRAAVGLSTNGACVGTVR